MTISEKLSKIAENEEKVFDAGKKSQYDEFWDAFQENGTKKNYDYTFYGRGWNNTTFNPKYDIVPDRVMYAFAFLNKDAVGGRKEKKVDIAAALERNNVKLDFRLMEGGNGAGMFYQAGISHLPELNTEKMATFPNFFAHSEVEKIDKMTVNENAIFPGTFLRCYYLSGITMAGCIGNDFDISPSGILTKQSIKSVVDTLSATAEGKTVTLSKTAVNRAFHIDVDDEETYPEGSEYYKLRNSKPNWTFSYK